MKLKKKIDGNAEERKVHAQYSLPWCAYVVRALFCTKKWRNSVDESLWTTDRNDAIDEMFHVMDFSHVTSPATDESYFNQHFDHIVVAGNVNHV